MSSRLPPAQDDSRDPDRYDAPAVRRPDAIIDPGESWAVAERAERPVQRKRRRRWPSLLPWPWSGLVRSCTTYASLPMLVIAVVLAFVMMVITLKAFDFLRDPLDNFLAVFGFDEDAEPEVVDTQVIILGIRDMSVLQTASGEVQITKEVVDTGAAPDARLKMSYIGSVGVGIDLSLFDETDVVVNADGHLTITLPPVQILDCALRNPEVVSSSCTDIPFVQDCDDIRTDLQDAAYDRSLDELREKALEHEIQTINGDDLFDVAYHNAEDSIADLIKALGYDVAFEFQRSTEQVPPSENCFP
ncbi:MAG: DUF4230 domain-containing protein [Anaerolineae bacterium]|nr:DUF4230 domain-containing protein [Anaerolineae bacterium]